LSPNLGKKHRELEKSHESNDIKGTLPRGEVEGPKSQQAAHIQLTGSAEIEWTGEVTIGSALWLGM